VEGTEEISPFLFCVHNQNSPHSEFLFPFKFVINRLPVKVWSDPPLPPRDFETIRTLFFFLRPGPFKASSPKPSAGFTAQSSLL